MLMYGYSAVPPVLLFGDRTPGTGRDSARHLIDLSDRHCCKGQIILLPNYLTFTIARNDPPKGGLLGQVGYAGSTPF
jgi:hypothetical protein